MTNGFFDEKKIYLHNHESSPVFEIRDGHIYKAHSAGTPEFRIEGHVIYRVNSLERAFEIQGNEHIVPPGGGAPIYDIR